MEILISEYDWNLAKQQIKDANAEIATLRKKVYALLAEIANMQAGRNSTAPADTDEREDAQVGPP